MQLSFEIILGPPGTAHSFSIYLQPFLWRWGRIDYHEQSTALPDGAIYTVGRMGWMIGPFTVYVGRR